MKTRVLIIGFGSDLRGDDMLGRQAAQHLAAHYEAHQDVHVLECASLTPDLSADLADAEMAVFIDCDARAQPAVITRRRLEPIDDKSAAMVHFLDPPALLRWAQLLYHRVPRAVLYAMGGATFACADTLSPVVAAALPDLIARVCREVDGALRCEEVARA